MKRLLVLLFIFMVNLNGAFSFWDLFGTGNPYAKYRYGKKAVQDTFDRHSSFASQSKRIEASREITLEQKKKHDDLPETCFLIDQPLAILDGPERRHIICQSELQRPTVEGINPSLEERVDDELSFQEALRYQMPIDDAIADKYIAGIREQHNLSMEEVEQVFESSGLTLEEGKAELIKMYGKNSVVEMKVNSRALITQQEVEQYYNANPEYEDARYHVRAAVIPFQDDKDLQFVQLRENLEQQAINVTWSEPMWMNEEDLAENWRFIINMKSNDYSEPIEMAHGFQVVQLVDKKERKLISLEKRYRQIVAMLRQPKVVTMMDEFKQDLRSRASIAYLK